MSNSVAYTYYLKKVYKKYFINLWTALKHASYYTGYLLWMICLFPCGFVWAYLERRDVKKAKKLIKEKING